MKNFLGKKILFITAHPDDESYVAAGTIYKNYKVGGKNILLCASLGEKGKSHLKKPLTVAQLKIVREKELRSACKLLHIESLLILGLPDGKLGKSKSMITKRGLKFAIKHKPEIIISFGPDGISGHYDHITIGEAARQIAKKLKIPFITFALPPKLSKSAIKWLKLRRVNKHYKSVIKFNKPTIKVKIDPRIKQKALRFHKSQMDDKSAFTGFPVYAVRELMNNEYFVS